METNTNDRNAEVLRDFLIAIEMRQQAHAMAAYLGGLNTRGLRSGRR